MGAAERDKRADDRLHVLSGALRAFAEATTDYERLLTVVAHTVSDVVADGCIVRLLSDGGWLTPVAFHFPLEAYVADAQAAAEARTFMTASRNVAEYAWGQRLIETGEAFMLPRLDIAQFRAVVTPEVAKVYETIGIHSMLVVVLRLRGESIGTLTLFRFDPESPSFDTADQEMAQALADHAALAIGNARSYAAERSARDAAEKATARFSRLSEAGVIGTVVINLDDKRVVDVNDTLLHLVGYSRDDLVSGRVPWASLTAPEWSDVDARAIEQLTTTGVAGLREKEFTRKDGTRVPILAGSAMLGGGTTECISFVLDLTERKEAERGRREAERRSQRMVESATVGMWTVGADGRTTFMNARMADILGRDVGEAVSMPTTEFFFAEDRPGMAERLAKRRDGLAGAFEQRFRRPDGAVGVLSIDSSPLYDAQGRYEGVLGIATDITERHRAEEALRASETRYRLMFDNSPLPKWMYDVETLRFLDVNDAAVRDYGYSRDDFLGMTIKDIRPPEDIPALLEAERGANATPKFGIWRLLKKSGEIIQVEITKHTFTLGERAARLAVGRDVTERLRLEEQLRESQGRFARLSESGIIGINVADIHGNIIDANDAYMKMVGYSREELLQGTVRWADLTPPEFRDVADRAVAQLQATGVAPPWETEAFRKDGTRVSMLVGVAMLEYPRCIAFTADVTERKQAEAGRTRAEVALRQSEAQLRQAQKMEAVGRLAGGVAHDFNNVLSVILSYAELILGDLKPLDPLRADIEEISKAASRAAGLTRQLLLFSRQQVVETKVMDLNDVLASMDKMLQRILGEDVEMVSVAPRSAARVKIDPSHVEQVILNLVVNARDAMPTGGKITIETANVVLDEEYARNHLPAKAGPHVMMAVTDTGIGMDRETQTRIFEPFFTTKDKGKGTGLGLSTVFGIVQQSGGSIWVYSEPGKGTTFKVYLPRVDAEVDVLTPTVAPTTLRGTETVLLAEDEEQVRSIIFSILGRQGYHVIPAQNGNEALLLSARHSGTIDLLLTDVVMPKMSGPELAKRLAVTRPEMRVLCMSGYTEDSVVRHGVLETGVAFIQKPITPALLMTKVREVLDAEAPTTNWQLPLERGT